MLANNSLATQHFAFPDVCLTPIPTPVGPVPVPIPYPNIGTGAMAIPPTTNMKQLLTMMPAHNMVTTTPITNGDQPGCMPGGVASGIIMGPQRNIMGSVKMFTGGTPATTWLKPSLQNMTNAPPGLTLVPGQFTTFVLS